MPDYNLGRAHGEIIITSDTRGAVEAAGAVAGLEAQSKSLNTTLNEAKRVLGENDAQYVRYSNTLRNQAHDVDRLKSTWSSFNNDYARATNQRIQLENAWREAADNKADISELIHYKEEFQKAQADEAKALEKTQKAWSDLERVTNRFTATQNQLDNLLIRHQTHIRNWEADLRRVGGAFDSLGDTILKFLSTMGKATAIGMGGAAGGGFLGLLGAGGTNLLITGIYGVTEAIGQMIGSLGVIPPAVAGAGLAFATLKISLNDFATALKNMDDPEKFAEAMAKLSPSAKSAARDIKSSWKEIKDSMRGVQEQLFAPMVNDVKPLINDWLPLLRNSFGEIARVIGEAGHELTVFLRRPEVMQTFKVFVDQIAASLSNLRPALEPLSKAFLTLMTTGASFLPQLAQSVTELSNKFSEFVNNAAQTGKLHEFIQSGLDGFKSFAGAIWDFGNAMHNIFEIGRAGGETMLDTIARLAQEFRNWTETFSGQQAIHQFFDTLRTSSEVLMPILKIIGGAIANVASTLAQLGVAIGPGLTNFFRTLAGALAELGPNLIAAAPALNQFLSALGHLIADVVGSVGDKLPEIFQTFADVLTDLAPVLTTVASALAEFMSHLTPHEVELLLSLALGFKTLGGAITLATKWGPIIQGAAAILSNPWVAAIAALAALVAGLIYAYNHVQWFHDGVNNLVKGTIDFFKNLPTEITNTLTNLGNDIKNIFTGLWDDAFEWGRKIATNISDGLKSAWQDVKDGAGFIADTISGHFPHSPAKEGPLRDNPPEASGENIAKGIAAGISAGAPRIAEASASAASGVAPAFESTDAYGSFTGGGPRSSVGNSGFDKWASALTEDLSAWVNVLKSGWDVLKSMVDIAVQAVKVGQNIYKDADKYGWLGTSPGQPPGQIVGQPQAPNASTPTPAYSGQTTASGNEKWSWLGNEPSGGGTATSKNIPASAPIGKVSGNDRAAWANAIYSEAKKRGYSDNAAYAMVEAADLESSLDPTVTNASGHKGLFQQSKDKPLRDTGEQQIQWLFDELGRQGGSPAALDTYQSDKFPGSSGPRAFIADNIEIGGYSGNDYAKFADEVRGLVNPNQTASPTVAGQTTTSSLPDILLPGGSDKSPKKPWSISGSAGAKTDDPRSQVILPTSAGGIGLSNSGSNITPLNIKDVSKNFPNRDSRNGVRPDLFLVHTEEGDSTAEQLVNSMSQSSLSYNYYVDQSTGEVFMAVPPSEASRGTGGVNQRAINAVVAGSKASWSRDEWLSHMPALQNMAYLAATSGVPLQSIEGNTSRSASGIGGHDWATGAGYPTDGHSDPGKNFPWDTFMNLVHQYQGYPAPSNYDWQDWKPRPHVDDTTPGNVALTPDRLAQIVTAGPDKVFPGQTYGQLNVAGQPLYPEKQANQPPAQTTPPSFGPRILPDTEPYGPPHLNGPGPYKPGPDTAPVPADANTNMKNVTDIVSSVGGLVNDGFNVASNVIQSIGAAANLTSIMARGVENTQDIMHIIDQTQTFLQLAVSISQTVADSLGLAGQITSIAGAAGGGGDGGGAAAAGAALGAAGSIAGMVTSAIGAINSAIEFGQLLYQEVSKVGATIAGYILGNDETGPLSGNVRMLLNTNTGQLITYSEDNSDLKNTINLPKWAVHSYTPGPGMQTSTTQLNIYAGPGQSTQAMMSDSMWLISTGAASVASVSGLD